MDFVDWCGHVLRTVIEATKLQGLSGGQKDGLHEVMIARALFGEESEGHRSFGRSTRRKGMVDALKELEKNRLLVITDVKTYMATPLGKKAAKDPRGLWRGICSDSEAGHDWKEEAEGWEDLLVAVNRLSAKSEEGYAWLEHVGIERVLDLLGWPAGEEGERRLRFLWEGLGKADLVHYQTRPFRQGRLELSSTYRGLVWGTRRHKMRSCDVFISHSAQDGPAAVRLKTLLTAAFGDDLNIFVSSDYRSISGGDMWHAKLLDALKAAPVTLVLLSKGHIDRRWIYFEAGVGLGEGGRVIPLTSAGLAKGEVGEPLSLFQVRSLADAGDVEGMLRDIAGSLEMSPGEADVEAFVAQARAGGAAAESAAGNTQEQP